MDPPNLLCSVDPYNIVKDENLEFHNELAIVKQEMTDDSCTTFLLPKEESDVQEDIQFNPETILPDEFTVSSSTTHKGITSNPCSNVTLQKEGKTLTGEQVARLIKEFELRPCLWQKKDKNYKNKHVRNAANEQIASIIGVSVAAVKEKLRSLRIIFLQNYRKMNKSGSATKSDPKWEHFNALLFMAGEATTVGELDSTFPLPDDLVLTTKATSASTSSVEVLSTAVPARMAPSSLSAQNEASGKRKLDDERKQREGYLSTIMNQLSATQADLVELRSQRSRNQTFGNYVALTLDNITDTTIIDRTKMRIKMILSEATSQDAQLYLDSSSPIISQSLHLPEPISMQHSHQQQLSQTSMEWWTQGSELPNHTSNNKVLKTAIQRKE